MEEVVQIAASGARAGIEITAELLKILAPALAKGTVKILGAGGKLIGFGIDKAASGISNAVSQGEVSRKNLFAEADEKGEIVKTTEAFPKECTDFFVEKAKEYKIHYCLNGDENSQARSISHLDRDSGVVRQIMQEWDMEKVHPRYNGKFLNLKSIDVSEHNFSAIKSQLDRNGVENWIVQSPNGELHCNFKPEDAEKVQLIMSDYSKMQTQIEENCEITASIPETARQSEIKAEIEKISQEMDGLNDAISYTENPDERDQMTNEYFEMQDKIENLQSEFNAEKENALRNSPSKDVTISDKISGESVMISIDKDTRKSDITAILNDKLGYSSAQADMAANKLAADLELGGDFFQQRDQMSYLDKMQVNIRYASDDISLRDTSFSAVKLKGENDVRLNVSLEDKAVLVTPAELSDTELKDIFTEHLGMTENQAEKAVAKARKIDGQIKNKLHETTFTYKEQRTVDIERISGNSFTVTYAGNSKVYDFSQVNLEEKISEDFGIPKENAQRIIGKAKSQSAIQNQISNYNNEKRRAAKAKKDPFAKKSDAKKVKR